MSIRSLLTRGRTDPVQAEPEEATADTPGDRRRLLKMLGATAVGAVGASLLEASPAGAQGIGNGQAVQLGEANTCDGTTQVTTILGDGLSGVSSQGSGVYGMTTSIEVQSGVYGVLIQPSGLVNPSTVLGAGVTGDTGSYYGVVGASSVLDGVHGLASAAGASGVAGVATSGSGGYGVSAIGDRAPILLSPSESAGAPTTDDHQQGELYVDSNGVFYKCVAGTTFPNPAGTWVPIYSVVPLLTPVRIIATPSGAGNTGGLTGPFSPNGDTHTTTVLTGGSTGIPDIAVGAVGNLTISANGGTLNGDGYLTLFPGGAPNPGTSSLNSGGDAFATSNGVTIAFGSGANAGTLSFSWQGGGSPPDCQVFLDVTAYIL